LNSSAFRIFRESSEPCFDASRPYSFHSPRTRSVVETILSSVNGLVRKSTAPFRIADTAISIDDTPVRTMTGTGDGISRVFWRKSIPFMRGIVRSVKMTSYRLDLTFSSPSTPSAAMSVS